MQATAADAAGRDSDIHGLLRAGQRERAFDALLQAYEGRIFRLCCALLRDRAQAEDAAQESLLRIWKALDADTDERAALLRELVDLLPDRLRRTVLLYYFEERSTREVALMLGCPEGTVKTHLFRARAALVEQLRKRGLDDASLWMEVTS
jgi:RNA polymerase sigma-70 factor (ECF subfamily)